VCHTQNSWHPSRIEHPGYALTGAHLKAAEDETLAGKEKQVKCFWCHRGEPSTFKSTKTDCLSCHATDRATSTFPGHAAFAATCEDCHSTDAWKPAKKPEIAIPVEPTVTVDAGAGAVTHTVAPHASAKPKPRATGTAATATAVTTATATATTTATATATTTATATPAPDVTSQASRRH
jgi:hypothetical protein